MANKTKTIIIFTCWDRNERDGAMDKMNAEKQFPLFQLYRYNKRNRTYGSTDYQIKATGSLEDIQAYQDKQKTKELAPYAKILAVLKVELEPLRLMFHEKTEHWSTDSFKDMVALSKLSEEELLEKYGQDPVENCGYKSRYIPYEIRNDIQKKKYLVKQGIEAFLKTAHKNAEAHYQNSVIKLASRIDKKGLDASKLTAKTKYSKIDLNISTTLTDGSQTLRARTIIASGPIQRPHYRYIVT